VEIYNFDLRNCTEHPVLIQRNKTFRSIYSDRVGINFKISSVSVLAEKHIMVFGVRRIGLLFYDMDNMKILKIESLTRRFIFGSTNPSVLDIIEIIPYNDRSFKLLTLRRGLIVVTYPELTQE